MLASFFVCVASFLVLVWHSRLIGMSLGLPVAYLFAMLFQHLPGAFAHLVGSNFSLDYSATQIGLELTAIGTACFVTGVVLAQQNIKGTVGKSDTHWLHQAGMSQFATFCLWSGWGLVLCAAAFVGIPSIGAAIDKAGNIWILAVLIGILAAVRQRRYYHCFLWLIALSAYPVRVLIWGGFLSFGSTSIFVVMSAWIVTVKSHVQAYTRGALFSAFCFLAFLSYFQNRQESRDAAQGGAGLAERVMRSTRIITDIGWFDAENRNHFTALDDRLNQNKFAGWAAQKLEAKEVDFLRGRSLLEGLQSLVPRVLWPDKPFFAGSSQLIREMTDFTVNEDTTYGPGLVMEFYVNFGVPSVVVGFLLFGFAYGWIDRKAAAALQAGEFGRAIPWFLPGVAMSAPLASIAELMGNVAAALVAAYGWRLAWSLLGAGSPAKPPMGTRLAGIARRKDAAVPGESN